ncbi:MAG: hypothetical protein V4668_00730 [Patescibacteria group bacterium]
MATYDGSGDIGYTTEELKQIVAVMQEAIDQASPEELHSISAGITKGGVVVNIRQPRHRGPIEHIGFEVLPYGTSIL